MANKLVELKPCPFCGKIPERCKMSFGVYIECMNGKCLIKPYTEVYDNGGNAVKAWNKRKGD